MNRLFFAVLAALILSAPPAAPAEERTAAQDTAFGRYAKTIFEKELR